MEIDDKIYLELCRLGIISNSTRSRKNKTITI